MEKKAMASVFVLVFGLSLLVSNAFGASTGVHQALQEDASIGKKNDMTEPVKSEGQPEPFPSPNTTTSAKPTPAPPITKPPTPPTSTIEPNSTTPSTPPTTATPSTTTTLPSTTSHPTSTPSTTTVTTTTSTPTAAPSTHRGFDAFSFIGGFILAVGLMGIGMVSWKFYVSRQENYYHTL